MAENLTSDSTSTTAPADPAPVSPPSPQPSTSTTEPTPPSPPATEQAEGSTLLTGGEGDVSSDPSTAGEDPAPNPLFGVPEGDYELTGLPEGTVIDADVLAAVAPIAKQLGLSSEGLSKLAAPFAEKIVPHITQQVTDQILAQSAQTTKQWATDAIEAVRTDEVYGGKPLADIQAVSAKALDRFGGTEFRTFLEDTGLGNHPAMLRTMFLAGSAISEDTTFERGGNVPKVKTREEKYYN